MKPLDRPSDMEIRTALDGILASAAFSRSERLRAFLSYVVQKDLAGQSTQLKGYTIAIDVFRRPDAFNADSDPLVRVHAGKLRKLLAAYDEGEGADAPWRIEIPKGGYAPVYARRLRPALPEPAGKAPPDAPTEASATADDPVWAEMLADGPARGDKAETRDKEQAQTRVADGPHDVEAAVPAPLPAARTVSRHRKPRWKPAPLASPIAMLSILPLLLFAPLSSTALGISPQVQARLALSTREADVGLPIVRVRAVGEAGSPAVTLADQVRHAMDYYTVIIPAPDAGGSGLASMAPPRLSFTISISPVVDAEKTVVTVSSDATGEAISVSAIDNAHLSNDMDLLFESLGIAAKTLATNGDLFRYASDRGFASPLMACMLITDRYRRELSREDLVEAKACQAKLRKGNRSGVEFLISASELKKKVHP